MKRLLKVAEILFLVLMIGICALVFMAGSGKVPYIFGYRLLQVVSDSMKPTIEDETCILIKKVEQDEIKVGDIITFISEAPDIKGYLNTHRVHEIKTDEETGKASYVTKGDAYAAPDAYLVDYEQIAGIYVGELPFGKLLFKGIQILLDRNNYFLIVMLPLLLCFMSYSRQLFKAIQGEEKDSTENS